MFTVFKYCVKIKTVQYCKCCTESTYIQYIIYKTHCKHCTHSKHNILYTLYALCIWQILNTIRTYDVGSPVNYKDEKILQVSHGGRRAIRSRWGLWKHRWPAHGTHHRVASGCSLQQSRQPSQRPSACIAGLSSCGRREKCAATVLSG